MTEHTRTRNMTAGDTNLSPFRAYLPDLSIPRFQTIRVQNAHEYVHDFLNNHQPPWLYGLYLHWRELFKEPFKGVTSDGEILLAIYIIDCFLRAMKPISN